MNETQPLANITRQFVWDRNRITGMMGWVPEPLPQFDAGTAFHVAHDVLEHVNETDASLEAEMRAFGATIYLRGETGYWSENLPSWFSSPTIDNEAAKTVASDMFSFLSRDQRPLQPPTGPIPRMSAHAENILENVMAMKYRFGNPSHSGWEERTERAENWTRIGYAEAATLYQLSTERRVGMFRAVRDAVHAATAEKFGHYAPKRLSSHLRVEVSMLGAFVTATVGDVTETMTF